MRHNGSPTPIHFLPVQGSNRKRSRLDREAEKAEAKSHAATVSHWHHKEDRKRRLVFKASRNADKDIPSPGIPKFGSCKLDPFLRLAVDLSLGERDLLQDYLTLTPQAVYGTSHKSIFCPVRDVSLASFWTNEVSLRWAVFLAQHYRVLARGLIPDNDTTALRYKQEAYKAMTTELASLDNATPLEGQAAPFNDTLFGVLTAGVIEHRLGHYGIARKHLAASFVIWSMQQRHGMDRCIACPTGLTLCVSFLGIGLDNFFPSSESLHLVQSEVLNKLEDMERWNHRIRCINLARFGKSQVMPPPQSGSKLNAEEDYLRLRCNVFGRNGIVRAHLSNLMQAVVECGTRLCLGALYVINDVLYALRDDESSATTFISSLVIKLRNPDGSDQLPRLSRVAIMYIIASCTQDVRPMSVYLDRRFSPWSWVQFVELIVLASDDSKRRMTATLGSWLFADMASPEELSMASDWRRDVIEEECETVWLQERSATLANPEGHMPSSED